MLNDEDYGVLKKSLVDSQRLFNKLNDVANETIELEYDESGLFYEKEEVLERHWLTLSSKIVDALSEALDSYSIELLKNESLETRELTINLTKENVSSRLVVDYSEDGALSISQIN